MANLSEWESLSRGIHAGEDYLLGRVRGTVLKGLARVCWLGVASPQWEHKGVNQVDGGTKWYQPGEGELKKKKNGAQPCFCPLRKFHYISALQHMPCKQSFV